MPALGRFPARLRPTLTVVTVSHPTQRRAGTWGIVGRVLAGVISAAAAVVSAWLVVALLSSILGPPSQDPHGYVLVFGSLLLVPSACVGALALPFATPPLTTWRRIAIAAAIAWVVGALVLVAVAL